MCPARLRTHRCEHYAAVWVSEDGASWTRAPDQDEVFGRPGEGHDFRMFDIVYGDGVYIVHDGDANGDGVGVWLGS